VEQELDSAMAEVGLALGGLSEWVRKKVAWGRCLEVRGWCRPRKALGEREKGTAIDNRSASNQGCR
jgi:hypothetical protein